VRRPVLLAPLLWCALSLSSLAQPSVGDRIAAYFRGWYTHIPGSEIVARPTREVVLPGLEAYRVERHSNSKSHQESGIALYDAAAGEVFVGDVFNDPDRAAARRPFDRERDLPNIESSLREMFGLPVNVEVGSPSRVSLTPLTLSIRQGPESDAVASRTGFISNDGAVLMLGEFHPLSGSPEAFREKLLSRSEGVRVEPGSPTRPGDGPRFTVTEFLDFQCDRCRVRTPDVRRAVAERGGIMEVRFLPIVKMHDWSFAAAEAAAALAGVRTGLYQRYEETVFARSSGMTPAAAREIAADIAEAAGAREAFAAELSSGRAQGRVLRDIGLAMRLGVVATPSFLYKGTLLPGEKGQLEVYLFEQLPASPRRTATPTK
jgi:protein-disulfide isomerase